MSISTNATVTDANEIVARELVTATREFMLAATTTGVEAATVDTVVESLGELTRTLNRSKRKRAIRAPFDEPARARASEAAAWEMGGYSPMGIPLTVRFEGEDSARASLVADALHEGPPDLLHGGFAAYLMDCILGVLLQARGIRAMTASLDLQYLRPTPLDDTLELSSRICSILGRKITVEGWIEHAGVHTVEARGLFIAVPPPVHAR